MNFNRKYDRIISLGCDCTIKSRVHKNLQYKENFKSGDYTSDRSFPFDYTIADNLNLFVKCIQENFYNFNKLKTIDYGRNTISNEYDVIFVHHFEHNVLDFLSMFERRINRFQKCVELGNTLFIRYEKIKLDDIMLQLHKNLYDTICKSKNNDLWIFHTNDSDKFHNYDNIQYIGHKIEDGRDYVDDFFKSNINKILM